MSPGSVLISLGLALAGAPARSPAPPVPEIAQISAEEIRLSNRFSDERQFLAADTKGRLHLFRGASLRTHRLKSSGQLDEPEALKPFGGEERSLDIVTVALAPAGDAWLAGNATGVRYFVGGKEVLLPEPDFIVTGVGLPGGTPTVAIEPKNLSGRTAVQLPGEVPYLLQLDGDEWRPLASERLEITEPKDLVGLRFHARVARRMAAATRHRLWVAHQARYLVELLSPAGKRLLRLQVGTAEPGLRRETAEEHRSVVEAIGAEMAGSEPGERIEYVNRALADGGDGRLYLLVSERGGALALDRLDALEQKLERVHLANVEPQGLTLASSSDGLYLASVDGSGGVWRISWEVLEGAQWTRVVGVAFDGEVPGERGDKANR
jgi:hypothetical protein